jgi:hypothetical protein
VIALGAHAEGESAAARAIVAESVGAAFGAVRAAGDRTVRNNHH